MSLKDKPAFPNQYETIVGSKLEETERVLLRSTGGMTLRQYYAGLAMQGFLSSGKWVGVDELAQSSINIADALIAELEKANG